MASKPARIKKTMKFSDGLGQYKQRPRWQGEVASKKKQVKEAPEIDDHLNDKICVLCCEEIYLFAKGSCDHVVCYKCSSRMRALCEETYCAVCRHELKKVMEYTCR